MKQYEISYIAVAEPTRIIGYRYETHATTGAGLVVDLYGDNSSEPKATFSHVRAIREVGPLPNAEELRGSEVH